MNTTATVETTEITEPISTIEPTEPTEITAAAPASPDALAALFATAPPDALAALFATGSADALAALASPDALDAPAASDAPGALGSSDAVDVSGSWDALAAVLAQAPPSAGLLDALRHERLSAAGCLDAVVASERLLRHVYAALLRALGALAGHGEAWLAESEVCAALAWSPATAQHRLAEAEALTRQFPATLQLLAESRISIDQARALTQLTAGLDEHTAQTVQARVLARMPGQSAPVTRQAIRRAIVRTDPDAAAQRHKHERARRRVELRPEDDGMATLEFYLPADIAQMAMRTLTALAHSAKRKNRGDKRTLDQRRADLLPALLHGAATGAGPGATHPVIPARVHVVVGIDTLLGLSHEPGHLQGYGPICPEQTRRIAHAHAAQWRFLLTATDGTLIDTSPRSYTPTAAVKRLTELKFTTCAFPHCHMPADRCDLDHNHLYHKGGATEVANLAPLCRKAGELGVGGWCQEGVGGWGGFADDPVVRVFGELDAQAVEVGLVEVFGDLECGPGAFGLVA